MCLCAEHWDWKEAPQFSLPWPPWIFLQSSWDSPSQLPDSGFIHPSWPCASHSLRGPCTIPGVAAFPAFSWGSLARSYWVRKIWELSPSLSQVFKVPCESGVFGERYLLRKVCHVWETLWTKERFKQCGSLSPWLASGSWVAALDWCPQEGVQGDGCVPVWVLPKPHISCNSFLLGHTFWRANLALLSASPASQSLLFKWHGGPLREITLIVWKHPIVWLNQSLLSVHSLMGIWIISGLGYTK